MLTDVLGGIRKDRRTDKHNHSDVHPHFSQCFVKRLKEISNVLANFIFSEALVSEDFILPVELKCSLMDRRAALLIMNN